MSRMKDTVLAILFLLGLYVVLPASILWLRDRIFHTSTKGMPEQMQARMHAYRERLANPQQALVEAEIGALWPQMLIAMYSDRDLVLSQKLNICPPGKDPRKSGEWIDNFLPLNSEGQKHTCDLELLANAKGFCFAGDGCGNFYWVPVSNTRLSDAPVFFACYDPWGNEKIADSLEEFLSWPRFPRKKA